MTTTEEELASFNQFAQQFLNSNKKQTSIDVLYDKWRIENPSEKDAVAVLASIRDMENGETGISFEKFSHEFKKRNNLPEQ